MAHDRLTRIERTALLALSLTSLSILSCILLWHSCGHKGYTPTETELQKIKEFRKAVAGMEADTTVPDVPAPSGNWSPRNPLDDRMEPSR